MFVSDIKNSFEKLQQATRALNHLLLKQRPALYLPDDPQHLGTDGNETKSNISTLQPTDFERLPRIISDFYYKDDQDGRETRSFHGVVNATLDISDQVILVNQCKDDFRAAIQAYRQQQGSAGSQLIRELQKSLIQTTEIDRSLWGYSQLSRLHLKQTYRHIPVLPERPEKIGFSWYMNGKSIKKVSHKDALELLYELGDSKPHIRQQIELLAKEPRATQLVQIQNLAPIMRANIRYQAHRQAMNCSLPLFIPAQTSTQQLPTINDTGLKPEAGRTRKVRSDDLVEPQPLLKSLRIHRIKTG